MSQTENREKSAAFVFAYAIGLAFASVALELVFPLVTPRAVDAMIAAPIDRPGMLSGAFFRIPLMVVAFGVAILPSAGAAPRSLGRSWAYLLTVGLLFLDAISYRWLGEQGSLLHIQSTLLPARAFAPLRLLPAGLATVLASALAFGIGSQLEPRLTNRFSRNGVLSADMLTWSICAFLATAACAVGPATLRLGVTPPLVALFTRPIIAADAATTDEPQAEDAALPADGIPIPPTEVREILWSYQAVQDPEPLADPSRPFCRVRAVPERQAQAPRSVTLLVLRGVGVDALRGEHPAMPALARLSADNASFENVVAGADDPTQGLVQLLAGVAPLAPTRYHEVGIIPRLPSLPSTLKQLGIDSYFVSTRDLSPGRERTLVHALGFDGIDEPTFAEEHAEGRSSGSDVATLAQTQARLLATQSRARLVVATLDGGRVLDAGAPTANVDMDAGVLAVQTTPPSPATRSTLPRDGRAALDAELAAFVTWWSATEAGRGGVLVLVGDSARAALPTTPNVDPMTLARFHVPLILVNLKAEERERVQARTHSLAGLLDVAQTILGLEGQPAVGCFQGRDLLTPDDSVPSGRRLAAFAGPDQRYAYVFDGRFRWQLDRTEAESAFNVFDLERDPALAHDLYDAHDVAVGSNRDYLLAVVGVGRYLASNDRYVPGQAELHVTPLPRVPMPEQIAIITGSTRAEVLASVTARKQAGFTSAMVSVAVAADLAPTIAGEPAVDVLPALIRAAAPRVRLVLDIGLPEFLSPERSVEAAGKLAAVLNAVAAEPPRALETWLFPRDPVMAMSLAARSPYTVFLRLPGSSPDLVEVAFGFGVDGIVFENREAAGTPLQRARHEGMRVAIAGIDSLAGLPPDVELPDFVITPAPQPLVP